MTPTEYWHSIGKKCCNPPQKPFNWCNDTVVSILSKQEYIGDTVNFRYTTRARKGLKDLKRNGKYSKTRILLLLMKKLLILFKN